MQLHAAPCVYLLPWRSIQRICCCAGACVTLRYAIESVLNRFDLLLDMCCWHRGRGHACGCCRVAFLKIQRCPGSLLCLEGCLASSQLSVQNCAAACEFFLPSWPYFVIFKAAQHVEQHQLHCFLDMIHQFVFCSRHRQQHTLCLLSPSCCQCSDQQPRHTTALGVVGVLGCCISLLLLSPVSVFGLLWNAAHAYFRSLPGWVMLSVTCTRWPQPVVS